MNGTGQTTDIFEPCTHFERNFSRSNNEPFPRLQDDPQYIFAEICKKIKFNVKPEDTVFMERSDNNNDPIVEFAGSRVQKECLISFRGNGDGLDDLKKVMDFNHGNIILWRNVEDCPNSRKA